MKTTLTFADLNRTAICPTLKQLDSLLSAAKALELESKFPELKLGKTFRFTTSVLGKYAASALAAFAEGKADDKTALCVAYAEAVDMVIGANATYVVDVTFATVLRSELFKLRNAVKALSPEYTEEA